MALRSPAGSFLKKIQKLPRYADIFRQFSRSSACMGSQQPVGFVGLGQMGNHMAKNLITKGYPVIAYDVSSESLNQLKQAGGEIGSSPADVASKTSRIVTMLPASQHVIDVYTGSSGIFSGIQKNSLLIDSSTIDPSVSKEMSQEAEKNGANFVDAPVSGGVNAARDAILTFMVGGSEKNYEAAKDILNNMGKNVVHCGDVGTGQAAKICNNMMLAIAMIGTSETMNLGTRLGLDPKLLAKILNMSSGRSWCTEVYNPFPGVMDGVPSSNDYKGGFGSALMAKDLGLAQNAATATKSATPLGSAAHQIYRVLCNSGFDQKDFSSVFKFIKGQNE